jgi:branched-subunit amino acid transport protein
MLDFLRGSVRPVLSYVVIGVLATLVLMDFINDGELSATKDVLMALVAIGTVIIDRYFKSREK